MMGRPRSCPTKRFWSKVNKTALCWEWTAQLDKDGYGVFRLPDRHVRAHRFSYELIKAKIPLGWTIHHHCGNKKCVNPAHLEAMTAGDNNRQADHLVGQNLRKTHCKHGHEFTEENTLITPAGFRWCRACERVRYDKRRQQPGWGKYKARLARERRRRLKI